MAREKLEGVEEHQSQKGLAVARTFFTEWGLPYLRSEFSSVSERAGCFLFGGSQSLGNDDELSRDHGWGLEFSIVLPPEDMHGAGRRLRKEVDQAAPTEWRGIRFRKGGITIHSLNWWFRRYTKFSHAPKTTKAWLRTSEDHLYMLRRSTVFHDPLGEWTARKATFHYYPRKAWLTRIRDETFDVHHFGQYNFLDRMAKRREPISLSVCLASFMHATMKLCMLLNEDFNPYWKWLSAEFRKQPNVANLTTCLTDLASASDIDKQVRLVDVICQDVYSRLVEKNFVSNNPTGHPHPLMCAYQDLSTLCEQCPDDE